MQVTLRLERTDHATAKRCVEAWHYSHAMPAATDRYAVFEDGQLVGVVLFGPGAGGVTRFGARLGVDRQDVRELVRVALTTHQIPVSRVVAICARLLRRDRPNLRLLMSYADPNEGHHGGIYQAGGWVYTGTSTPGTAYIVVHGQPTHRRTCNSLYGTSSVAKLRATVDPNAQPMPALPKHRYLMALDPSIRDQVAKMARPYPKRARSETSDTADSQSAEGGATPTLALHDAQPARFAIS